MLGLGLVLAWIQDPQIVQLRVGEPVRIELTASDPLARVSLPEGEFTLHVRSSHVDAAAGADALESGNDGAGTDEERWVDGDAPRVWSVGARGALPAEVEIEVTRGRFEPSPAARVRAEVDWCRAAHEAGTVEPRLVLAQLLRTARAHQSSAPAAALEALDEVMDLAGPTLPPEFQLTLQLIAFEARVALADVAGAEAPGSALLAAEASGLELSTEHRYAMLRSLGAGWVRLEQYSRARPVLVRAVELEIDPHRRAELYALLADLEVHSGRYAEAWTWLRQLQRYCEGPEPRPKLVVDCASRVTSLAQPGEALRLLENRAELIEAAREDSTIQAGHLARAIALEALERYEEADAAYGLGLAPPGREPARGWNRFALSVDQARCRRLSGNLNGALESARIASFVAAEIGGLESMAIALDALALVLLEQNEVHLAGKLAASAKSLLVGSENVEYELALGSTRARTWVARGEYERALEALLSTEHVLDARCRDLRPEEAASVRSGFVTWAELGIDLATRWSESEPERAPELARDALVRESRWKGRSVLGGSALARPDDAAKFLERVQEGLGERVLVEYAAGARNLCALVVSRRGVTLHDLGDRRALRERTRRFTSEVLDTPTLGPAALETAGHELFEVLLGKPLDEHGSAAPAELVVAPTPDLALLPFEALVSSRPQAPAVSFEDLEYLVRSASVTTTPSALFLAVRSRATTRENGRALILGDPIYRDTVGPSGSALPRLTRSRDECCQLAQLLLPRQIQDRATLEAELARATLPTRRSYASPEYSPVQLKLGAAATPDELVGDLREFSVVYVAAHAHGNPIRAGDCAIQLSPNSNGRHEVTFDEIRQARLGPSLVVLAACESALGPVQRGDGLLSLATAFLSVGARDVLATRRAVDDAATFELMVDFASRLRGFDRATGTWSAEEEEPARALRWALLRSMGEKTDRGGLRARRLPGDLAGHPYTWARYVLCGS